MTEHHRNQFLHKYHDACPVCYKIGALKRPGRYYCACGAVWRWRRGSLKSPVICSSSGCKKIKPYGYKAPTTNKPKGIISTLFALLRVLHMNYNPYEAMAHLREQFCKDWIPPVLDKKVDMG